MKIISNRTLRDFAAQHPQADESLQSWRVGELAVFDIGGNKCRLSDAASEYVKNPYGLYYRPEHKEWILFRHGPVNL